MLNSFGRATISSLYEATENELQGSGMAISKKINMGPQSHLFRKKTGCLSTLELKLKLSSMPITNALRDLEHAHGFQGHVT
jgi:hypothetical protein